MRGKPALHGTVKAAKRNIPAYAGKTDLAFMGIDYREEHPRVCGENTPPLAFGATPWGTSPRMRGKPSFVCCRRPWRRNIPAYAGKTSLLCFPRLRLAEHPRVCGENLLIVAVVLTGVGTSPRMRGKPLASPSVSIWSRNIPAYAGKTR